MGCLSLTKRGGSASSSAATRTVSLGFSVRDSDWSAGGSVYDEASVFAACGSTPLPVHKGCCSSTAVIVSISVMVVLDIEPVGDLIAV